MALLLLLSFVQIQSTVNLAWNVISSRGKPDITIAFACWYFRGVYKMSVLYTIARRRIRWYAPLFWIWIGRIAVNSEKNCLLQKTADAFKWTNFFVSHPKIIPKDNLKENCSMMKFKFTSSWSSWLLLSRSFASGVVLKSIFSKCCDGSCVGCSSSIILNELLVQYCYRTKIYLLEFRSGVIRRSVRLYSVNSANIKQMSHLSNKNVILFNYWLNVLESIFTVYLHVLIEASRIENRIGV